MPEQVTPLTTREENPVEAELDWENFESVCPICGNAMVLINGFHRCRACGYKESCCYL